MRGEIILKILKALKDGALSTEDFFKAFLTDRGTSYRMLRGIQVHRPKKREKWSEEEEIKKRMAKKKEQEFKEKHRFYIMLTKCQKQGLIKKTGSKKSSFWHITNKGDAKFEALKERLEKALPSKDNYQSRPAKEWKIVIWDIPEGESRKRIWLRAMLRHLGFNKLQKSVWIGKIILPEDFLEDLKKLHLLDFVEIFAITKSGSIEQIE